MQVLKDFARVARRLQKMQLDPKIVGSERCHHRRRRLYIPITAPLTTGSEQSLSQMPSLLEQTNLEKLAGVVGRSA